MKGNAFYIIDFRLPDGSIFRDAVSFSRSINLANYIRNHPDVIAMVSIHSLKQAEAYAEAFNRQRRKSQ